MAVAIRVLYVDDEPSLLNIGKLYLERSGDFAVTTIPNAPDGIRLLEQERFDAIISDYQMPGMDGIQFLVEVRTRFGQIPFILFTGRGREEVVIQAINSGADFYLQKGGEFGAQFAELSHKIKQAASRKRADDALRESEEKFRTLAESSRDYIMRYDRQCRHTYMNPAAIRVSGLTEDKIIGKTHRESGFDESMSRFWEEKITGVLETGKPYQTQFAWDSVDGRVVLDWMLTPEFSEDGTVRSVLGVARDITQLKTAEEEQLKKNEELTAAYEQISATEEELRQQYEEITDVQQALRESETRYREFFTVSRDSVFSTSPEGRWIDFNDAILEMFGYESREEMFEVPVPSIYADPEERSAFIRIIERDGYVKEYPTQLKQKDGTVIDTLITAVLVRNPDGSLKAFIGTIRDVTVRKQAEEALRKSEERYRSLFEGVPMGLYRTTPSGQILDINSALVHLLGYPNRESLLAVSVSDIYMDPGDRNRWLTLIEREGIGRDFEVQFRKYDGTIIWVRDTGEAIRNDSGRVIYYNGNVEDITDRKRAEDALRENEESYRTVFENTGTATVVVDESNIISLANTEFGKLSGFSKDDIEGKKSWTEFVVKEDLERMLAQHRLRRQNREKALTHYEFRFVTKSGDIRDIYLTIDVIPGTKKSVASLMDISDRKRAEEALRESEQKFHAMADFTVDWEYWLAPDGSFVYISPSCEVITGYSPGEFIAHPLLLAKIVYPDDTPSYSDHISKVHGCSHIGNLDLRIVRKDGKIHWISHICRPVNGGDGTYLGQRVSNRDITDRKRVEEELLKNTEELYAANEELETSYEEITATEEELRQTLDQLTRNERNLRESEEKYRTIFENTGTATVVIDESNSISLANTEFAHLSGFSKDDIEGKKSWTEFVVKEDLERMLAQHRLRRQNQVKALTHYEFRFVTRSGDIRNIHLTIDVIPGTKKSIASLMDITDRKRAEELYQTVFENTGTAMIILEEDTTVSHVNDEMEKIWGYSRDEIEGRVKWPKLVAAEDLEKMLEYHRLRRTDPDSAPRNYEFRFIHKDGGLRDAALTAAMVPGTKKSVVSLRDITEFKKAEQALRVSEERLKFAIESAHLGLWDLNFVTYDVIHNRQWTEMLGFSGEEMDKPSGWWQERVHPDDLASVTKSNEDHITGRSPYFDCIYRMKHKNGEWRWVHTQGNIISRDRTGAPLRMIGINQDITDHKQAEEALRESNEYLHKLIDFANSPIIVWDPEFRVTRFNHAFEHLTGRTEQEVLGQKIDILFPVESREASLALIKKTLEGERWETVKIPILVSDGTIRIVLWNSANILTAGAELVSTIAQGIDITQSERAETALRESEQKYRTLVEHALEGILILDLQGTILFANNATARTLETDDCAALIGRNVMEFIAPESREDVVRDFICVSQGHDAYLAQYNAISAKGNKFYVESIGKVISYEGKPADLISIRDITERKLAGEAFRQANKKLTLLSSITRHDINNQLLVLMAYLTLLEEKEPDLSSKEYFGKVETAAKRISAMIQFTKEYEQIGVNAPVWQDCRTLVDSTAKQAPLGPVTVKNDLPAGTDVFADPLIVKVFYNLMDNAVRYGGKITMIRFSVQESGDYHLIVCADDGVGILAEEKEKIFNRGYGKNSGMGLFLSREILSITGITIRETGEPGKGARFEMVVPKGAYRSTSTGEK